MAILVLGGAGYIGSHMVDRLVEKGQEKVVVVDSLVTGHRAAVHPDAIFYQGDLSDQDFMRKVFKENPDVDAVIHFAAYSLVGESMEKPLKYFDNNININGINKNTPNNEYPPVNAKLVLDKFCIFSNKNNNFAETISKNKIIKPIPNE